MYVCLSVLYSSVLFLQVQYSSLCFKSRACFFPTRIKTKKTCLKYILLLKDKFSENKHGHKHNKPFKKVLIINIKSLWWEGVKNGLGHMNECGEKSLYIIYTI